MKKLNLLILIGLTLFMAGCSKDDVEGSNAIIGKWYVKKYEHKWDCEYFRESGIEPIHHEQTFDEGNYFEFKKSGDCLLWIAGYRVETQYLLLENGTKIRFPDDRPAFIDTDFTISIDKKNMTLTSISMYVPKDDKCTGGQWLYLSK